MAHFEKREGKRGVRWLARIRKRGQQATRTFPTKGAAQNWARAKELAIDTGEYRAPIVGAGPLFADAVDALVTHRKRIKRAPGKTYGLALERLKKLHGLEPLASMDVGFWHRHALTRMDGGAGGATVAQELIYASGVLRKAARDGHEVDATGPSKARSLLNDDGINLVAKSRTRRLSDAEIAALLEWIDANKARTDVPMPYNRYRVHVRYCESDALAGTTCRVHFWSRYDERIDRRTTYRARPARRAGADYRKRIVRASRDYRRHRQEPKIPRPTPTSLSDRAPEFLQTLRSRALDQEPTP